jgi:hypothetical protein
LVFEQVDGDRVEAFTTQDAQRSPTDGALARAARRGDYAMQTVRQL